jgi:hypothetical protein
MNVRQSVREYLDLLSQPSRQIEYEARIAPANSHGELVSWFCSDLFRPKSPQFLEAFTENEVKHLARLYGLLIESGLLRASSVADLLREPEWRRIARFARELVATIDANGGPYGARFRGSVPQRGPESLRRGTLLRS